MPCGLLQYMRRKLYNDSGGIGTLDFYQVERREVGSRKTRWELVS